MVGAAGKEVLKHKAELEAVLIKIAEDHTKRCSQEGNPCSWQPYWLEHALCDIEEILERYHVRKGELVGA